MHTTQPLCLHASCETFLINALTRYNGRQTDGHDDPYEQNYLFLIKLACEKKTHNYTSHCYRRLVNCVCHYLFNYAIIRNYDVSSYLSYAHFITYFDFHRYYILLIDIIKLKVCILTFKLCIFT